MGAGGSSGQAINPNTYGGLDRVARNRSTKLNTNIAATAAFQQRFLRALPQLDSVLTAFAETIISLCDHYDILVANATLISIFDFVISSCMEPTIEHLSLIQDAGRLKPLGTCVTRQALRKLHVLTFLSQAKSLSQTTSKQFQT